MPNLPRILHLAAAIICCTLSTSQCQSAFSTKITNSTVRKISTVDSVGRGVAEHVNPFTTYHNPFNMTMIPDNVPPNLSVSSFCSSSWLSAYNKWVATAYNATNFQIERKVLGGSSTEMDFWDEGLVHGASATTTTTIVEVWQAIGTGSRSAHEAYFKPTYSSPCCQECAVFGGDVRVFYWPSLAPKMVTSTLVDDTGFTLYTQFNGPLSYPD